ncbi:MAG TPA: phosphate ABC transporter substrate-binding protein [Clostridiales bacterium]|nr:phosphate ABC transporter substrate-binding protein [Clostridiales bacterium]
MMKKMIGTVLVLAMVFGLAACGGGEETDGGQKPSMISVVSREEGSGTRGAFIELVGIEEKDAEGNKIDKTSEMAEISNSTSVVLATVMGNKRAIGYISLGSMNDDIKALAIDGAAATVDNIKSGTYSIARPFHLATLGAASPAVADFLAFAMSAQGQAVVEENGYISAGAGSDYQASGAAGKVRIAGSSSVTPVMEKIKEAYVALNPSADIQIQQSDSTTGMTSAIEGICDIGMASRNLKDSELEAGLEPLVMAMDGIAVIVNLENPVNGMTLEQVKSVFIGETTDWNEIGE